MPIDTSKTGAAIAAYRQRMNMSQQGLAGLMNVTHQAVSKWEKGLALPDTETLLALAKLFGASMEDLLMGKLPAEPKQTEEPVCKKTEVEETVQNESAPAAELGDLDFSSVINMLPFVSTKTADHLFRIYTQDSQPDAGALFSIAPFVSTGTISEYISSHPLKDCSPEVVASLAPFLSTKAVDDMILGMDDPIPPHVMQMLMPFVSTKTADHLFRIYTQDSQPDAGALISIAPFVSTGTISEYINRHPLKDSSPEVVASLAPFLSTTAVDDMILGMDDPIPPHVMQMLMPFASTRVADQMVMGKLGIPAEVKSDSQPDFSKQLQDKIHQKIRRKLDALDEKMSSHPNSADAARASAHSEKRETPRMRLIRKAIENGQYEMVENCFDELDDESRRMLLEELAETGDAKLLTLFCESAEELDPNAQNALIQILLNGRLYNELAEIIDELDEDVQHKLLDKAFELNDPELLHLISEHL